MPDHAPARKAPDLTPGVPARRAALRLLDAVLRRGQPLETALHGATQGLSGQPDRALVHAITAAVLRHMRDLDALIDGATQKPLPDDAKARMVLRIALAQALLMGTAPHAVIATLAAAGRRRTAQARPWRARHLAAIRCDLARSARPARSRRDALERGLG